MARTGGQATHQTRPVPILRLVCPKARPQSARPRGLARGRGSFTVTPEGHALQSQSTTLQPVCQPLSRPVAGLPAGPDGRRALLLTPQLLSSISQA